MMVLKYSLYDAILCHKQTVIVIGSSAFMVCFAKTVLRFWGLE